MPVDPKRATRALQVFDSHLPHGSQPTTGQRLVAMLRALEDFDPPLVVTVTKCQARQVNEQMHCGHCGLQWDRGDPERPECSPVERRAARFG